MSSAAVKLAVDEIGAAPEKKAKRCRNDQIIAQIEPGDLVSAGKIKSERQHSQHPAVTRHSAFPYAQDRQWLTQHFRLVEQNVTEAAAQEHPNQRRAGDEIPDFRQRQIGVTAAGQNSKQ